jgi:transcriptional antiterminator RfaH
VIFDTNDDLSSKTEAWYLVHCQSQREFYAASVLRTCLGLHVFLPAYDKRQRGKLQRVPFFPGYIFIRMNMYETSPSQINTSPGVVRLVDFGGGPSPVPSQVIESIASRLVDFDAHRSKTGFQPGEAVRVKQKGPLQNLEMVFVGPMTPARRVCVLLNFLGQLKEVTVDVDLLEKAPCC